MRFVVYVLYPVLRNGQVYLCRRNILMSQKFLQGFEVSAVLDHVHREGVPKDVGRDPLLLDAGIAAVLFFGFGFLFPDFINAHPTFFAATGCAMLVLSAGFLPLLYFILDDRDYKKARATHYEKYLKMLLPKELECNTALISYMVYALSPTGKYRPQTASMQT